MVFRNFFIALLVGFVTTTAVQAQTQGTGEAVVSPEARIESLEYDVQRLFEQYMLLRIKPYIEDDSLRIPLGGLGTEMRSRAMSQDPLLQSQSLQIHEAQWFLDWYFDTVGGGSGIGSTPGFQNCTADCRRKNCRGLVHNEWIDCAVACDIECRNR